MADKINIKPHTINHSLHLKVTQELKVSGKKQPITWICTTVKLRCGFCWLYPVHCVAVGRRRRRSCRTGVGGVGISIADDHGVDSSVLFGGCWRLQGVSGHLDLVVVTDLLLLLGLRDRDGLLRLLLLQLLLLLLLLLQLCLERLCPTLLQKQESVQCQDPKSVECQFKS